MSKMYQDSYSSGKEIRITHLFCKISDDLLKNITFIYILKKNETWNGICAVMGLSGKTCMLLTKLEEYA